ncbi:MAG: hypothetical protein OXC12_04160 [Spirochaetaceae bacterium]|nr:hypothetical protein [Spirochaetaceae bacterium]
MRTQPFYGTNINKLRGFSSDVWREQPLGTASDIVILLLVLVSIFSINVSVVIMSEAALSFLGARPAGPRLRGRLGRCGAARE